MISKFFNIYKSLFFLKIWNIGSIKINQDEFIKLKNLNSIEKNFVKLKLNNTKYTFFADPFPISKKLVFAEAMNKKNIGELVLIDFYKNKIIKSFPNLKGHVSFPFVFSEKKNKYLIPEISHWSNQLIYKYDQKKKCFIDQKNILGLDFKRLKDPVLYKKKNYYLFYNTKKSKKVDICFSKKLFGPYKSIKNISKQQSGFRMGGDIISSNNCDYRISQNNSNLYGDGIKINKIIELNSKTYNEKLLRVLKFSKLYGPHTISFIGDKLFFDYYVLKPDIFAFFRKLIAKVFS
mgnify:CR=1 FL=1